MTQVNSSGSHWREGLLRRVGYVYTAIFVGSVAVSLSLMRLTALLWFGLILGLAQLVSYLLRVRGVPYRVRAWIMISAPVGASASFYFFAGLYPGPVLAGAFTLVLTTLLLGRFALIGVLLVMVVFLLGMTGAMWFDLWQGPLPAVVGLPTPDVWLRATFVSTLFWSGICLSVLYVVNELEQTVRRLLDKEAQRRKAEQARREAEEMAVQSQKLEALGQLAAGIAHDFNNALLVLRGWTDILKQDVTPELKVQANDAIEKALDQSEQLATQLLTFGRKQQRSPRYLSLREVVENTGQTLGRVVQAQVKLHIDAQPTGFVHADEAQLQQVLLNLVLNARDAMPGGGDVTVRSRPATAEETVGLPSTELEGWAVLEVEDNGSGMDEDTRQRIFEPFFTTKDAGKGTGLGLATVFGIAEQSKAHIRVWSEPQQGSRFTLLFPSIEAPVAAPGENSEKAAFDGTGLRVLVLEDEKLARDLVVFALEQQHFEVLVAADGDEALAVLDQADESIHLLNADAMFPGASLDKVIEAYERSNPDGKVLICSGYVPEDIALDGLTSGRYEYLPKPFTSRQLVAKIAAMLA